MKLKSIPLLLLLPVLMLVLVGCSGDTADPLPTSTPHPTLTPVSATPHSSVETERTRIVLAFNEPILSDTRALLRQLGIELLNPVGSARWMASVETGLVDKLEDIELISQAEEILPAEKLSEDILEESSPFDYQERERGRIAYSVMLHNDSTISEIETMAKELDAQLENFDARVFPTVRTIILNLPRGSLERLAEHDIVAWIEPSPPPLIEDNRESSRPFSNVDAIQTHPYMLDGSGIRVGVWDGGEIDINHSDLKPRVEMAPGQTTPMSGHAIHVVGTIGSSGVNIPAAGGMAPNVDIRVWDNSNYMNELELAASETDPRDAIQISNHSYGLAIGYTWNRESNKWEYRDNRNLFGKYTTLSESLDSIVKDTDHIIFNTAGNERTDGQEDLPNGLDCEDGLRARTGPSPFHSFERGYDCIEPRAVAKNVITVGAAYQTISNTVEGEWPADFSSFGPTDDGRIKPDLVAHGVGIISLANDTYTEGVSKSGTSMAAPAAAGIGALVLQEADNLGISVSAAGMKALLIQTARDIPSFESGYPLGETFNGPDFRTGWGAIDAEAAIDLLRHGSLQQGTLTIPNGEDIVWSGGQVSEIRGISYAESTVEDPLPADTWTQGFEVRERLEEIHVTLAWTDPPAIPSKSVLVHDLDLRLISPDGRVYRPWSLLDEYAPHQQIRERLDNGQPITSFDLSEPRSRWFGSPRREGADDYINNVEQVSVVDPAIGTWAIKVTVPFADNSRPGNVRGALTESQNFAIASNIPISPDNQGAIGTIMVRPREGDPIPRPINIADAEITFTSANSSGLTKRTRSGPSGFFRISLFPGVWNLRVTHPDYERFERSQMNIYGREGETDFSSISLYMDPRVPGAPTNVTATAGDTQVTVTWTAPISDDEPAVTGYTVTVNPGGHVEDVDDSILTATVTGLVVGTDYSVTVTARNRLGDSDPSDPRSITTTAVPGAPTIVSASGGDAHVTLTWTAPTSDGGSAIIGYMVTVNPGDHEEYVDGSTLTATVTGLAVGTEYTVRVIARNLLGDSDSSDPRSITTAIPGARTNLTNNLTSDLTPAWSPDGSQIAFSSLRTDWPNYEIYVMNADGTGQTRLTHNFAWDSSPAWSPDGLQIAFESSRDSAQGTGREEIYVMNADGTGQTNLTNNPLSAERYPTWSPDGSQIAFYSDHDGNWEIYVMDADGLNQTRLTNNSDWDAYPAWSPDGTQIAFASDRDGDFGIYLMDTDGSNQTKLIDNLPFSETYPAWSPDAKQIAFSYNDNIDYGEIYVMDASGNNQTRLTNNPTTDSVPAWSPDGSQIAFASNRDGYFEIYVMDADGNN